MKATGGKTLSVDTQRTFELLPLIPAGATVVAESGFRTRAELDQLDRAGVDAVLVGEHLVTSGDPAAAIAALRVPWPRTARK